MEKIIALCGPKDSGKTTTLNRLIDNLNRYNKEPKTIEYANKEEDKMVFYESYKGKRIVIATAGDDDTALIMVIIFALTHNFDILIFGYRTNKKTTIEEVKEILLKAEITVDEMMKILDIMMKINTITSWDQIIYILNKIFTDGFLLKLKENKELKELTRSYYAKLYNVKKQIIRLTEETTSNDKIFKAVRKTKERNQNQQETANKEKAEDLLNCLDEVIKELNQNP